MADEYYQKAGEYPYLPDIPTVLSDVLPPVPYSFYEQTDGEYPVIADMPDVVKAVSPVPYSFYEQAKDEYPKIDGLPNVIKGRFPVPYSFYGQDGITNNGYPFLELPNLITKLTMPLPYIMYEPNKSKEIEYKIIVRKCDNDIIIPDCKIRVTVPKYDVVVQNEVII